MLIDALNGRSPSAARIKLELGGGALATTAITVFELRSSAKSTTAAEQIETLLAGVTILRSTRKPQTGPLRPAVTWKWEAAPSGWLTT